MDDVNNDLCKRFQAFGIIVIWNANFVKLCKLLSILNNPNTLHVIISFHIGRIFNPHKKYGLSLIDQAQNLNKTRKRHKFTRYGFSKIIFRKKFMWNVYC